MKKLNIILTTIVIIIFIVNSLYGISSIKINQKYNYSVSLYRKLKTKKVRNKRKFSTKVIRNFFYLYKISKSKRIKAKCLFLIGKTYDYLAKYYQTEIFADLAISIFYRLNKEFPKSSLCDDARYYAAVLYYDYKNIPKLAVEELKYILKVYSKGDYARKSRAFLYRIYKIHPKLKSYKRKKRKKKKPIRIKGDYFLNRIRCLGFKNFSRIVFDLSKLPKFKITKKKNYIKISLKSTVRNKKFKIVSINKNNIKRKISFKQKNNYLIVILNVKNIISFNYYTLKKPYRLVVDVEIGVAKKFKKFIQPHDTISTIVIDPGHGGHDPGAIYHGIREKDITIKIGKLLKYYLSKKLNKRKYTILLTRATDKFISLEDRATFANRNNADLFISIHCNAARNRKLHGFETYYLNPSRSGSYLRKRRNFNDVEYILEDMVRTSKVIESKELAIDVQKSIVKNLSRRYGNIEDLGVKEAPFYVLLGTRMPAILVENSFISNRMESRRLKNYNYLKLIALSISDGIVKYIKSQKFVKPQ